MDFPIELVIVVIINCLAVGISWGSLKTRVGAVEKKLDNGLNAKVHKIDCKLSGILATCTARGERLTALEEHASNATPR